MLVYNDIVIQFFEIFFTSCLFVIIEVSFCLEVSQKAGIPKMILIPIGEIYAQVAKSATSYYTLIVLPLTNFTLHPLTCCVIDKGIKGLV